MSDELRVSGPPCRHPERRPTCPFCERFHDDGIAGQQYRAALLQRVIPTTVIPTNPAALIGRPGATPCGSKSVCIHEGGPLLACSQPDERFKVRHCDHPEAEWDICARQTRPIRPEWGKGQNCSDCPLHESKSPILVP